MACNTKRVKDQQNSAFERIVIAIAGPLDSGRRRHGSECALATACRYL